jgi:predicted  nucleic acid-binding Zn-ribbon protein
MRLNAVLAVWLLPAARLRARLNVGVAEEKFRQAASVSGLPPVDSFAMENAPVAFMKYGSKAVEDAMTAARGPQSGVKHAAPTSTQVEAHAKRRAEASIHGRVVGPNVDAEHVGSFDPISFIQLSKVELNSSNESDVPTSAPPTDLAGMLAKLDNISAEVQETELETVALQTKVSTAESQIAQNAVSLEEAYQALHTMEGAKANNTYNIHLMDRSSGEIQFELGVQSTELNNLTGELGNLEVNLAGMQPAAQDLGTKAHEVSDKVKDHIPALENVTSRLDSVEEEISALEERMGTEGVAGPVKEDMDALVNGVSAQVHDLDDTVANQGIPRRLIIKDPAKLLLSR